MITQYQIKEKVWLDTIHYTWPLDKECKHYCTQFGSPGSIPVKSYNIMSPHPISFDIILHDRFLDWQVFPAQAIHG